MKTNRNIHKQCKTQFAALYCDIDRLSREIDDLTARADYLIEQRREIFDLLASLSHED